MRYNTRMEYSLDRLKSGLQVLRVPMASVASVTALVLSNTGSRYEKSPKKGLAHFFEHMVFKGTENYPTAQILASKIDALGANFNAFTSKEYTGYYVKAASRHLPVALDVLSDMILRPALRQEDIDREKGVIIEELNMYLDTPARHVGEVFDELVFTKESGLAHGIVGTKKTITSMTTENFEQFLAQWYGLENLVLVLAGDADLLNSSTLLPEIEAFFSKKPTSVRKKGKVDVKKLLTENAFSDKNIKVSYKKTEQAHFVLGWPALKRGHDQRHALSLASIVIGGNMSSRLFIEVREQRGLCYYVHSFSDQYHDLGIFGGYAGVDPTRIEEALRVMYAEFLAVSDGTRPITAEELQKAKDYVAGTMALDLEDSESVAQYFGSKQLLKEEIETPEEVLEKIKAVTLDEVNAIITQLVKPGMAKFAVVGPYKDSTVFEEILGLK